jgi:hypothetical protein
MTQEWKTEFFEALSKKMETFTGDNILMKNEANGEWMLKTVFATSPERESFVVVQGIIYPAREDVLLLELYIKLTGEAKEEAMPELKKAMEELNSYLPVGALGISPSDRHVYLRDCFKLPADRTIEENVSDAVVDYELIMEVVVAAYPGLCQIWSGDMTFDQTVEKNLLKRYSTKQGGK